MKKNKRCWFIDRDGKINWKTELPFANNLDIKRFTSSPRVGINNNNSRTAGRAPLLILINSWNSLHGSSARSYDLPIKPNRINCSFFTLRLRIFHATHGFIYLHLWIEPSRVGSASGSFICRGNLLLIL